MFLKSRLSQRYSLKELGQPRFGHKLPALWEAFKLEFLGAGLERFDDTIATLDRFEKVRYPDETLDKGAQILVEWNLPASDPGSAPRSTLLEPMYKIIVTDIDHLVAKIFEVCSRNPAFFTCGLNEYARDAITRDNPVGYSLVKAL
jgi:hypothetical protein